ncbi:hypothetical protein FBUS_03716, partial [Fasciolopsis buskii]
FQRLLEKAETALRHVKNCGLGLIKRAGCGQHNECDQTILLFRPISIDWSRKLPTLDRIGYAHQALILGYLCAMLSGRPAEQPDTVHWTPNIPTLIAWSGRTIQQWPVYIHELLANYPEVRFHLLPRSSSSAGASESTDSIFLHLTSHDLVQLFQANNLRRKERVLQQFVLSRCLLTSLYGLFGESHSRLL